MDDKDECISGELKIVIAQVEILRHANIPNIEEVFVKEFLNETSRKLKNLNSKIQNLSDEFNRKE